MSLLIFYLKYMQNIKQKYIQIITVIVLLIAIFLNIFIFWSEDEKVKWNININININPYQSTNFNELDTWFLYAIEKDTWLKISEIKNLMETNSWKTLWEIFSEKWLKMR